MIRRLETEDYHISEDIEYFGDLEPFKSNGFPTNSIIFKTLPGFGATYWEICYERNSIIIVPPVPAIIGKINKHPNVLGVYKNTTKQDIKAYLKNNIYPKKILTTPEGYIKKVKPILESPNSEFNLFEDFFLLFDECDRLITDVKYRGKIIAPIDDFFKFKSKAMVSATAIEPSDSRFFEHGFKIIRIIPDYDYKKDLRLISTNNIIKALRKVIRECNSEKVFIFLNSTLTIKTVIDALGIENKSKVFCAEESVKLLNSMEFWDTSSDLNGFKKYNFFTCRFFSAVDIDLKFKPDVILITDIYNASFSILDPMTDVIQISGRFRKEQGSLDKIATNSITHITNYRPNIKYFNKEETLEYLDKHHAIYQETNNKLRNETDEVKKTAYRQQLKGMEIADFLKENGAIERFMVDNELHHQRVRSYYKDFNSLYEAYNECNYFNIQPETFPYPVSDDDNMKYALANTNKKLTEAICNLLVKYSQPFDHTTFVDYYPAQEIKKLRFKHWEIVEAFFLIGYEPMKEQSFKMHLIKKIVDRRKIEDARFKPEMIADIYAEFDNNENRIIEQSIISRLKPIYKKYNFNEKINSSDLRHYYKYRRTENTIQQQPIKVYIIIKKLHSPFKGLSKELN